MPPVAGVAPPPRPGPGTPASRLGQGLLRAAEGVAAALMAALFLTFMLQIAVRYAARIDGLAEAAPFLDPARYGWTLEFCLALWIWIVFWGNAFVVRDRDHVTFDILYLAVRPGIRRGFAIVAGLAIAGALAASIGPTWEKLAILRLKRTATLSQLLGDWVRMRDVYAIYMVFLVAVPARCLWQAWRAARHGVEAPVPSSGSGADPERGG